jgi:hypothetical protein
MKLMEDNRIRTQFTARSLILIVRHLDSSGTETIVARIDRERFGGVGIHRWRITEIL